MDKKYTTIYKSKTSLISAVDCKITHNRIQKKEKQKIKSCLDKTRGSETRDILAI